MAIAAVGILIASISVMTSSPDSSRLDSSSPGSPPEGIDQDADANPRETTTTTRLPPSGQAMPNGDLPGWGLAFADDFDADADLGEFPGATYADDWDVYRDGTPDTAGQNEDGNGRYYPSKVVSVRDGILNKFVHTEDGVAMGAALIPRESFAMTYGRYSVRFRAEPVPGFKLAWLLWPDSERWPDDGEIDYPEGTLDQNFYAATIFARPWEGRHRGDRFETGASMNDWHTATTEWLPGEVRFYLDDVLIGTSTNQTPDKPMHWVLQTETCVPDCLPSAAAKGNVQIDWVAMWNREPISES